MIKSIEELSQVGELITALTTFNEVAKGASLKKFVKELSDAEAAYDKLADLKEELASANKILAESAKAENKLQAIEVKLGIATKDLKAVNAEIEEAAPILGKKEVALAKLRAEVDNSQHAVAELASGLKLREEVCAEIEAKSAEREARISELEAFKKKAQALVG
jgi:chromosome segregation ATPase